MQIKVRTLTGKTVDVTVEPTDSVLSVKEKLERDPSIGVPPQFQRLIFEGRELADPDALNAGPRAIQDGHVLHLVLRTVQPKPAAGFEPLPIQGQIPPNGMAPGQPQMNVVGVGYGGAPMYYPPPARPLVIDHDAEYQLLRTSSSMRLLGCASMVLGLLLFIDGLYGLNWASLVLGLACNIAGFMGLKAGSSRLTVHAIAHHRLLWVLILVAAVVLIIDINTSFTDNHTAGNVIASIVVGAFAPLIACGACAFVARRHMIMCMQRDQAFAGVAAPGQQVQMVIQQMGPAPVAGGPVPYYAPYGAAAGAGGLAQVHPIVQANGNAPMDGGAQQQQQHVVQVVTPRDGYVADADHAGGEMSPRSAQQQQQQQPMPDYQGVPAHLS